ncbi:MAG: hypothetical protein MUP82_11030 [Candidatus Marinimicrobia bacterium]|nr:hypothetical protein [Candidatus Neomarinimicrobiota bacterium]
MLQIRGVKAQIYAVFTVFTVIVIMVVYLYPKGNCKQGLRICDWNVEWFGMPKMKEIFNSINMPLYDKMVDNMYDIKYYIDLIAPDIICFQEVASISTIQTLTEYLLHYDLHYDSNLVKSDQQFNVFLVKKNVQVIQFVVVDDLHKMIRLDFRHAGNNISLYNVHLKADYEGNFSDIRVKQTQFLNDYMKQNYNPNTIITGDTNSQPGSKELEILENTYINVIFSRKCHLKVEKKDSLWFDKDKNDTISGNELFLIDYYLVSRDAYKLVDQMMIYAILYQKSFQYDISNKISDHYPIILDLY